MDSSVWDSSDSEMDLIKKESQIQEERIQQENIRIKRKSKIEDARIFTENALQSHRNTLVMFLGYIKTVALLEDKSVWVKNEKRVWEAIIHAIHMDMMQGIDESTVGKSISNKIMEIVKNKKKSIDEIKGHFKVHSNKAHT
ncbi:hypothetical protein NEAUS05_2140 [Nematocida ausubeli]|nr:hypothetical protein NEAUS07_1299 [Nematocida ausubeli]KAI5150366.1 hypothetical protein NEAUS05_2140 [Nematocida ausubeli]